jgi:hypothetical protein
VIPPLHDDRVDDAGKELLELLYGLLLGGPKESHPELPEEILGREAGRKVVLGLETPPLGSRATISRWRRRNAVATRLLGELADSNALRYRSIESRLWSMAWATRRSSRSRPGCLRSHSRRARSATSSKKDGSDRASRVTLRIASSTESEELEGLLDELLVKLEDPAVAGVRVDQQLVVRQTSGHVERVRRRQHPVLIAVRGARAGG